ncbi:MAG: hypothetical protein ACFE85_00465 [Candidatus Hodarchaeota archaeon]
MDCIAQILQFYERKLKDEKINSQMNKVWLSNLLIKLMMSFNGKANSIELRNCLILLVNLFSDHDSLDHYNGKGKCLAELSENERIKFKKTLLNEFN